MKYHWVDGLGEVYTRSEYDKAQREAWEKGHAHGLQVGENRSTAALRQATNLLRRLTAELKRKREKRG